MLRTYPLFLRAICIACVALSSASLAYAEMLYVQSRAPGGSSTLLNVYELNGTGSALVSQNFYPEWPTNTATSNSPKDLVIESSGRIHQYNGQTFDPYLSTRETTGQWTHRTHPQWTNPAVVDYGGIGQIGNTVFVTSISTANRSLTGIVAFDVATGTSTDFADGFNASDISVGLNGSLWALGSRFSFDVNTVREYDPATFQLLRTVTLTNVPGSSAAISIAVDANGDFFVGSRGYVSRFDSNGARQQFASSSFSTDLDISSSGRIAISGASGLWLTDRQFSQFTQIESGRSNYFASFQSVPEPSSLSFVFGTFVATWLIGAHRNRARRKQP